MRILLTSQYFFIKFVKINNYCNKLKVKQKTTHKNEAPTVDRGSKKIFGL